MHNIDSGAGPSTGPAPLTGNGWRPATTEYCTDVEWLGEDEGLRVQAAQGKAVRAAIRAKWIIAWHVQGDRAECMCVKANLVPVVPGSHFWMLATGAHGIGHKAQRIQPRFPRQPREQREVSHNGSDHQHGIPSWREAGSTNHQHDPLSEKLKAEVAGVLTGRGRTKKGILTLLGQGLGPERMIQFEAAGALTEAEMWENIETFAKIATSCENETRAVLNATGGKVDPTMSLHSLFGHRSVASVKKGIDVGDIVGHEEYTKGVDFRKACGKTCVPCMLGNARNKPHSASKPNAKHIPP